MRDLGTVVKRGQRGVGVVCGSPLEGGRRAIRRFGKRARAIIDSDRVETVGRGCGWGNPS